jgi:hypothetical protein
MNATCLRLEPTSGEQLAAEASRYLRVVAAFASLDCDPHARARTRAARARASEQARPPRRRLLR